jgi:hypothetical protein
MQNHLYYLPSLLSLPLQNAERRLILIKTVFQAIGIVIALAAFAVMTIATMYITYILALGALIVALIIIAAYLLRLFQKPP